MKTGIKCRNSHEFESSDFSFNGIKYLQKKCKTCGLMFTVPEQGINGDIYDSGHYTVQKMIFVPMLLYTLDFFYFHLILKSKGLVKKSHVLDFGSGKGFFLYFLKSKGYHRLYGVETSKPRAEFSRNLTGLNISNDYYHGGDIMGRKYDFITLIHVLEHIPEPFSFLNTLIEGALESEGCLFIEVPNINSFSSRISGRIWAHFTPHFHTNHFTSQSIEDYCKERSLKYSFVSSFSFYHSVMGMTSAVLFLFGYRGSLYEDLKGKKLLIILALIGLFPITFILEVLCSLSAKKGSVIKFLIYK